MRFSVAPPTVESPAGGTGDLPAPDAAKDGPVTRPAPRWRVALTGVCVSAWLSGCAIAPTLQLAAVATKGAEIAAPYLAPHRSANTVHFGAATPKQVCIEFNAEAPAPDLLPALQAELRGHGITTRVLVAGGPETGCQIWLRYVAVVQWDTPRGSSVHRAYVAQLSLTLQDESGALMSTSQYQLGGWFAPSKWSPTRDKVAPVVRSLVTGFSS